MDSKDPQVRWGPITLAMSFPFVAYVFRLPGAPTVCLTAHLDEHRVLLDQSRRLLEITLIEAKQRYEKWQEIPCLQTHVEPSGQQVRVDVYPGSETEPERIAEAVLRGLTHTFIRTLDGKRCEVIQYAPEPGEIQCRYEFRLQDHPDETGFIYAADEPDRLDRAIRASILGAEASRSAELGLYALEASTLNALEAFHSFHHALRLATAAGYPALIAAGLDLGARLLATNSWDYADWVAAAVARLADACERPMERVQALRIQGIACSRLGVVSATVKCFESAVDLLPRFEDPLLKARLRMSFGLSLMDLLVHWETLDVEERRAAQARMHQRLEVADRELRAARALFAEADDDRARRNLRFIDLELLRVRDLRGDHAGALSALDALASNAPSHDTTTLTAADIDQVKYEGTRLHYRLAAAIKVAESDGADSSRLLTEAGSRTVKQANQLPTQRPIADRLCCLMVLASRRYLQLALDWRSAEARASEASDGRSRSDASAPSLADEDREWIVAKLGEVKENLAAAWKIQRSFELNNVRPPRSGIEYGGLSVIDVSGLLQQTLLLLGEARSDPGLVWEALARADEIKGRFFQRDLAFSAAQLPDRVPVVVADALADLRSSLLSGVGDHRVVMAEFDRAIHFDMAEEEARRYLAETSFEGALTREEIRALLEDEGVRSAFVSFYATPRETLVYVVTSVDEPPKITRFQVEASTVESASARLQGDLRGYGTVGDDRVDPVLTALRRLFEAMLPQLLPLSRIVISAHGPWHGIPLHAALPPLLWKEGKDVGTVYVPSLKAWHLLQKRRHAMAAYGRQPIALMTVPAREDLEELFAEEHRGVRAVLERTGRTVSAAFGQEATLQRGLEELRHCGLHHFLAHGIDAGSDHAMSSGLLLASDSGGLPSRCYTASGEPAMSSAPVLASDRGGSRADDAAEMRARMLTAALMMANGTTASHVTLQACSVGRPSAGFRDELWGVTRALLAGGTSTVLAPLWDLDLSSSSQLLRRFYQHWLHGGQPAWLALASAQREMATGSTEQFRHFSHWGALQLTGC